MQTQPFLARLSATLFLAIALTSGCSSSHDPIGNQPDDQLIVGVTDWKSATTLEGPKRERSRAVGYLRIPSKGSRCTAWLVGPDLLVTNWHCISSQQEAEGAEVSFDYEDGVGSPKFSPCETFIRASEDADVALLRCAGRLGDQQGFLRLSETEPADGDEVYVIHQNCDRFTVAGCDPTKKASSGKILQARFSERELTHDADTLPGSSGAPVLSRRTDEVVGLHHAGVGNDGNGRGTSNKAVRLAFFGDVIRTSAAGSPPSPSPSPSTPPARPGTCDHSVCAVGGPLAQTCEDGCAGAICTVNPSCCASGWGASCVELVGVKDQCLIICELNERGGR